MNIPRGAILISLGCFCLLGTTWVFIVQKNDFFPRPPQTSSVPSTVKPRVVADSLKPSAIAPSASAAQVSDDYGSGDLAALIQKYGIKSAEAREWILNKIYTSPLPEAQEHLSRLPLGYLFEFGLAILTSRLSEGETSAALEWYKGVFNKPEYKGSSVNGMIGKLAAKDFELVCAFTAQMPASERADVMGYAFSGLASVNPHKALEFMNSEDFSKRFGLEKSSMMESLLPALVMTDPELAVQLAGTANNTAVSNLVSTWSSVQPSAALKYVLTLKNGPVKAALAEDAVMQWAAADPTTASEQVNSLEEGIVKDQATLGMIRSIAKLQPEEALAWAYSVQDKSVQEKALRIATEQIKLSFPNNWQLKIDQNKGKR